MLRRVLAETPGATLAFVGDGPERAMLEEHLAGLPVTFMVRRRMQGRVSGRWTASQRPFSQGFTPYPSLLRSARTTGLACGCRRLLVDLSSPS